jgi:hypothetical protein
MPLSRQQLPSTGQEDAVRPLRAAAFDARAPVTRRAAALETLFRADWERSAPRSRRHLASGPYWSVPCQASTLVATLRPTLPIASCSQPWLVC